MRRTNQLTSALVAAATACAALGLSAQLASGQCVNGWKPASAATNVSGPVRALHNWDPDGIGPLPSVLAATGDFQNAGVATSVGRIAYWDGSNWNAFPGTGLDGEASGLTSLANGHLFVTGTMANTNGISTRRIAGWDGTSWFGLNTGVGNIPSLAIVTTGRINSDTLMIVGAFTVISEDQIPANRVATWNSSTGWSGVGPGMSSTTSACIALPNGDIVVGGAGVMTGDSSITVNRVARWDGTTWNPMGDGFAAGLVRCFAIMPNGDLIAGGSFVTSGSTAVNKIARWNGTSWQPLGAGINTEGNNRDVYALAVMPNGDLIAGGDFNTAGGNTHNNIARWNGSAWTTLGPGDTGVGGPVRALAVLPNGDLAVGGEFTTVNGQPAQRFAIWSSASPINISEQPESTSVDVSEPAVFTAVVTGGEPITYRWQQQDLFNLPDFIDIDDGLVFDSFGNPFVTASGAHTSELTLTDHAGVAQVYRLKITNPCGTVFSSEVTLTYDEPCPADFDDNGSVEVTDIFVYLNAWFSGDFSADVDGTDGISITDIFVFLNMWFTGC